MLWYGLKALPIKPFKNQKNVKMQVCNKNLLKSGVFGMFYGRKEGHLLFNYYSLL